MDSSAPAGRNVALAYDEGSSSKVETRKRNMIIGALVILFLLYLSGDDSYTNDDAPYTLTSFQVAETQTKKSKSGANAVPKPLPKYTSDAYQMNDNTDKYDEEYGEDQVWEEVDIVIGEVEQALLDEVDGLLEDAENELDSLIDLSLNVEKLEIETILARANVNATDEQVEDVINEVYARAESKVLDAMGEELEDTAEMEIEDLEEDEATMEMDGDGADSVMMKIESEGENFVTEIDGVASDYLERARSDITSILNEIVQDVVKEKFNVEIDLDDLPGKQSSSSSDGFLGNLGFTRNEEFHEDYNGDYDEDYDEDYDVDYDENSEDGDYDINIPDNEDY